MYFYPFKAKMFLFFSLIFYSFFCFANYVDLLNQAIKSGDAHSIKIGINLNSVPVDFINFQKQSLLHLAVLSGKKQSLETLIDLLKARNYLDIIIDRKDKNGQTALAMASAFFEPEMAEILLENGADPNVKAPIDKTALFIALKNKNPKSINLLLKHKAELNFDSVSKEHLKVIVSSGAKVLESLIESGLKLNLSDSNNYSLLHEASALDLISQVAVLLKHGADPKKLDSFFRSPLYLAITISNNLNLVKLLVKHKADLTEIGNPFSDKDTYLHIVAENGQADLLEYLIEKKLPIDVKNKDGKTPLMIAIQNNHTKASERLIEAGADTSIQDVTGKTAFHYAAKTNIHHIKILLKHGADFSIKDNKGKLPIDYMNKLNAKNFKEIRDLSGKFFLKVKPVKNNPERSGVKAKK